MIEMQLSGTNTATSCGHTITARGMSSPIGKLARMLVADGYAEHDQLHITRNGTMCFNPAPLSYWAARDATESDAIGARIIKYKPMPEVDWS